MTCLAGAALFGWMARRAAKASAKARAGKPVAGKPVAGKPVAAPSVSSRVAGAAPGSVAYEPRGDTP